MIFQDDLTEWYKSGKTERQNDKGWLPITKLEKQKLE